MRKSALLALSPSRAVRRIALAHLAAAARAGRRLAHRKDREALHDFRVALRRLRSSLHAYEHWYDPLPEKLTKRLLRFARSTNEARDSEVLAAWLRRQRRRLEARVRPGYRWLLARCEQRDEIADRRVRKKVTGRFGRLETQVRAALQVKGRRRTRHADVTFAYATAKRLAVYCDALAEDLGRIRSVADQEPIHAARIRGKRVRYLIEPLRGSVYGAAAAIKRLKVFQDRFGELHDRFVVARDLAAVIATVDGGSKDVGPGLVRIADLDQLDLRQHYRDIRARYLGRQVQKLVSPIRLLSSRLADFGAANDSP